MKGYRQLTALFVVACFAAKVTPAHASCSLASTIKSYVVQQTSDIYVDDSTPAGTPLGRQGEVTAPAGSWKFNCNAASNPVFLNTNMVAEAAANGYLYELKIGGKPSGVGVRIFLSENGGAFKPMPAQEQVTLAQGTFTRTDTVRATLERTPSPLIYGVADAVQIAGSNLYNGVGASGSPIPFRTIRLGYLNIQRPTCSIDIGSLNQTVQLGTYPASQLDGGDRATPWVPFRLKMGSCADTKQVVDVQFGKTSDADNDDPSLFSVNTSGPKGIGIQLATDNDAAILPGTPATFPAVLSGDGYDFKARMKRSSGPVSAGLVNRPVTVLVTFR